MNAILVGALLVTQLPVGPDTTSVNAEDPPSGAVLTATEELRLGEVMGAEEEAFGWVAGIAVDGRGTLYVADAMIPALRAFNPEGRFVMDIGGSGEGPGEFRQIQGVAVLPGGGVAIWDPGLSRVTIFGQDGLYAESFPVKTRGQTGGPGASLVADISGDLLIRTGAATMFGGSDAPREAAFVWLRYGQDGEFVDSVVPRRRNIAGVYGGFKIETMTVPSPRGYFVSGRNDEYALHRPDGEAQVLEIRRAYDPVSFHRAERREWDAYLEEWDRRWNMGRTELPRHKPVWKSLFVDIGGRFWITRFARAMHQPGYVDHNREKGGWPQIEWREPTVVDVIEADGTFMGTVTIGPGSEVLYARGDQFWTLETGEYDEHQVVRYRMGRVAG